MSTFVLYYDKVDCRSCEDDYETFEEALPEFEEVVPAFKVNCSVDSLKKYCDRFETFPVFQVHNTRLETPVPQQFYGEFDAEELVDFV